jgi:mannose-6-phosphate isomerase-like protein (cupin superfamily)
MGAGSVMDSTVFDQNAGRGSNPTTALHFLILKPMLFKIAKAILTKHHYLHSFPGGTKLAFGIFLNQSLLGAMTFGSGPALAYSLVQDATPDDCLVLTRLWLDDSLPRNSESRIIAIALGYLKKYTQIKFIISYADPSVGHIGMIYKAGGWIYTGLSEAMPTCEMKSHVIFYVLDGEIKVTVNSETVELKKKQCLITEPATISMETKNGVKLMGIQIARSTEH